MDISLSNSSLEPIRQVFIKGLEDVAVNGRIKLSWLHEGKDLIPAVYNPTKKSKKTNRDIQRITKSKIVKKDGEYRTYKELAHKIAYTLMGDIGRGLSQEVYTVAQAEGIGAKAFATGKVTNTIKNVFTGIEHKSVAGKNDVRVFDLYEATFSLDEIIEPLKQEYSDQSEEFYEELYRRVQNRIAMTGTGEFFELAINVKGYMSKYDLQIAGEGSFSDRMSRLYQTNLSGWMFDKLVFMLNNTTKGCIMEDRISEIEDYIAAVCVAWMWDNPEELIDIKKRLPGGTHKVHLFNSGGAYFTASQIIRKTLERLLYYGEETNRFVNVIIKPPEAETDESYLNMIQNDGPRPQTKSAWNLMLQKDWETFKQRAMENGSLSIKFNQQELDELLGNLNSIINA